MFEVPKPRQFHYVPRFYDPEKERWEALKKKYADEHPIDDPSTNSSEERNDDLAYFEKRVHQLDQAKRKQAERLGWRDLFRKREMPQFHYTPRFNTDGTIATTNKDNNTPSRQPIKIRRRFNIDDEDYLKPVSGGKIILYCFLVCLLLYWVLF